MSDGEQKARYVEEVGIALEAPGIPRMLGRVVGALLLADPPELSAESLAAALHASLGTISTSTRALEDMSIVERVRKAGDRKQYYRLRLGAWHEIVRKRAEAFRRASGVAERGLLILGNDSPEAGQGLREMLEFMRFVVREHTTLLETWCESTRGSMLRRAGAPHRCSMIKVRERAFALVPLICRSIQAEVHLGGVCSRRDAARSHLQDRLPGQRPVATGTPPRAARAANCRMPMG